MNNKAQSSLEVIFFIAILTAGLTILLFYVIIPTYQDIRSYSIIKAECENTKLCFCDRGECVIKFSCSSSSTNGISTGDDCKEKNEKLCEIATKAKYKQMIWEYCDAT